MSISFKCQSMFFVFIVFLLAVCNSNSASGESGNTIPEIEPIAMSSSASLLPFDPNNYNFLIYVPNGDEDSIQDAMEELGIVLDPNTDIRSASNSVTQNDLATHDIFIVGWNYNGFMSGISSQDIAAGITGPVVLSGHDMDYHTVNGPTVAKQLFIQTIDFVLQGVGTGMITLGCSSNFPYVPSGWGVSSSFGGTEVVTGYTAEGLASGIFGDIEPSQLCNWGQSYHNIFTIDPNGSEFVPLELGGENNGDDVITVARYNSFGLTLNKTDDIDPNECVSPEDEIVYTINWSRHAGAVGDTGDIELIDFLPWGVTYIEEITTSDGVYDLLTHSISWDLGEIDPNDSGSRSIRVEVNNYAPPTGLLLNRASLYNNEGLLASYAIESPVCCWGGDIIYVNPNAVMGFDTGTSWDNAYIDLQDALERAANGCGDEIWVAAGTYIPGTLSTDNFTIPGDVEIYGGFIGTETTRSERKPARYKTYLNGDDTCSNIIELENSSTGVVVDGFIISNALSHAITCGTNTELAVSNCRITDNVGNGINFSTGSDLTVDHSIICDNNGSGINGSADIISVTNCWIHHNGVTGLNLTACSSGSELRNCTIVYNAGKGIDGTTANLDVINNILWDNNSAAQQYSGGCVPANCCYNHATLTCGDPDPNSLGNIYCDPCFAYTDETLGNFHLSGDSPCIDEGDNTNVITGETDIDNEDRINGTYVDMGADEYYSCDSGISCTLDYNADGVVNLKEFALFERAWLNHDPNDPNLDDEPTANWDVRCDLDSDYDVDLDDFQIFVDSTNAETFGYWLWQACWYDSDSTAVAMMRTATVPESTVLSDAQIESGRQARWRKNQPEHEYTTYETVVMVEDIIEIIENEWLTNPDFQEEISEEQYKESMQMLLDWLDELLTEWKSELSSVSKTAS